MAVRTTDWTGLERAIDGEVVLPGSAGWEAARRPALARFRDAWPAAVVRCATPGDVAGTIAFARQAELPLAARSGGHCFAGHSTTDGIVIDVGPMAAVAVDDGIATIGAGARLGAVYDALDAHGLAIPAGCGPRVGVAGRRGRRRPHRPRGRGRAPPRRPRGARRDAARLAGARPRVLPRDEAGAVGRRRDRPARPRPNPNFPEPGLAERPRAYHGANLERLVHVRERYDPGDVFRAAQSIPIRASARRLG